MARVSVSDFAQPARVCGGNPPLFPFVGRHRVDGKIGYWRDAKGTVRELPMHGFARDLPFEAHADVHGAGLRMILTDSDATRAGYPFGFRFEAAYSLADARTLDVTFTTTNTGDTRLPYYAGHHFYFTLPHTQRGETTIDLEVIGFYRNVSDLIVDEDDGRKNIESDFRAFCKSGLTSRITRYWFDCVKMVEMMRWPNAS